jgi:O-antigen/teichoic acid export membrane protein
MIRGLVLARLLGPDAFGLFAGIVAFTSVAGLIAELGLTPYVVFRGDRARADAASVATFSLASGLIGAVAVALLAYPIAEFYGRSEARWIALALAVSVPITTLAAAPMGILRSELKFADIGLSQGLGEIAALASALLVALLGGGIWSLVTAFLVASTVALVMLWRRSGLGLPRLRTDWRESARTATSYGGPVVLGAILWAVALQGDNVIVGHNLGTILLGLYAFAYGYGTFPGGVVGTIIGPVVFPTLVRVRHDLTEFRRQFLVFVRLASLVALPSAAVGVALAPVAIDVILGHQWARAAHPLQLFLVVGTFRALFPTDQVVRALGQTRWELIQGLVAAPATVLAALLGSIGTIVLVAALVSVVAVAISIWSVFISARMMRVGVSQLLREPLPACLVGLACGLAAWFVTLVPAPAPVQLVAGLILAGALYILILRSDRVPGAADLKDLARSRSLLMEPI